MVSTFKGIGVGFAPDILADLDRYALERGVSRAEAIRASVNVGLPMLRLGIALNAERTLTILEHTQLALSTIIDREYPDVGTGLIQEAMQNVREHHG